MKKLLIFVLTLIMLLPVYACAEEETAEPADDFSTGMTYYMDGDYENALVYFERASADGNADAQFVYGAMYVFGYGVAQDYATGVKWITLAAEQGVVDAQDALGSMYYYGYGVEKDLEKAKEWFELAAAQGNANAQIVLDEGF